MKKFLVIFSLFFSPVIIFSQVQKAKYLGVNILQLPALTINSNYSRDLSPLFTAVVDAGYTINYQKAINIDLPGMLLTAHEKSDGNEKIELIEYDYHNRAGVYLKAGGYLNLRKNIERQNFLHLGLFSNTALVYEKADEKVMYPVTEEPYEVRHALIVTGFSFAGGYEFVVSKRFKSQVDLQYSLPVINQQKLYGFRNFIPGMGFKDNSGHWFPMLIWNLKYRL